MDHPVVSREAWQAARDELLRQEKEHTRWGDELAGRRRQLPWVRIEKEYELQTDDGPRPLAELFDGRSQLVVYHLQFGPTYDAACPVNSSIADGLDALRVHLNAHDVTVLLVSQAALPKIQAYRERMGWELPWASAAESDFNVDFGASSTVEQVREWAEPVVDALPPIVAANAAACGTDVIGYLTESPWLNVFAQEDGRVYQTYGTTGRGLECVMSYYPVLDRTPHGRDEAGGFQLWLRRHDEYR